jgi:acyl-CoA thioesterase-1
LPNVVIICLGTNDMNAFTWQYNPTFADDYAAMIEVFRNLSSHPVVYVSLPPWVSKDDPQYGYTEARLTTGIIPPIESTARAKRACLIDFHQATLNHPEYYFDGLHPNDLGYTILAARAFPVLTN